MGKLAWLLGTASLLAATGAAAQEAAAARPAASTSANEVQEIVVTAQRRSQNLLSVPLAISAETGEQLVEQGIREVSALQFTTPGLITNNGSGYVQVFIRGVGNTIFVGADPSVATFIDDVPRIYGSLVNSFVNVERVEVLKGAQGGLYGRNATGGVVNIITRQPSDEPALEGRLSYGSHDTIRAAAYLNVPLAEGLAWNASVGRDQHDGYIKNRFRNPTPYSAAMFPDGSPIGTPEQTAAFFNSAQSSPKRLNHQDFWAFDSKLRYENDRFRFTLAGDYARKHDDSGNEYTNADPEIGRVTAQGIFSTFGVNAQLPVGFYGDGLHKFEGGRSFMPAAWIKDYGVSGTAVLSLAGADVTSITAWRKNDTRYFDEQTGLAPTVLPYDVNLKKKYFYQELRVVSTGEGPFEYLFGGSYLNTDVSGRTQLQFFPPLFTGAPTISSGGVENWSLYAQLGYDITDELKLTVSGRYINESNSVSFSSPVVGANKQSVDKFLPAATLSYALGTGGNVYVRYAKGFKAGGVNTVDPPNAYPTDLGKVFGPEQVDTYEGGLRTRFLDNRLAFTSAIFYNDYKGLQTFTSGNLANPGIVFAIVNAGSARSYGAEANFDWRATEAITLGLNVGYLNAKYKTFANNDGTVLNTFDFSGERMLLSPEWQVGISGNLDQPITDRYNLIGAFLASYTDDVKFFNSSSPGVEDATQSAYWIVNARAGVKTADDRYQLSIYVNNLFNKGYFTSGNSGAFGRQMRWGDPRIVGLEFSGKFM